jgi:hypothetical protein
MKPRDLITVRAAVWPLAARASSQRLGGTQLELIPLHRNHGRITS